MPNSTSKSFTLVELLLVVTIIGILSGTMLTVINPERQRIRARDSVTRSMLEKMVLAVDSYYSARGHYPLCQEFLRVVSDAVGDSTLDSINNRCNDANDHNVTFSIDGIELPQTCSSGSHFYGQGSSPCNFHYNGSWSVDGTTNLSPHFYVKTWEDPTEYFCWNPLFSGNQILIDCDRTCGEISADAGTQVCN